MSPTKKTSPAKSGHVALQNHYLRDLSLEVLTPPNTVFHKGEREIQCNIALHCVKNASNMLDVVMVSRVFILRSGQNMPALVADHAYLGTFDVGVDKDTEATKEMQKNCADVLYPLARNSLSACLQQSGYNPPLPETVDFGEILKNS